MSSWSSVSWRGGPRWQVPHHAPVPSRRVFGPYLRAALRLPATSRSLEAAVAGRLGSHQVFPAPTGRHALWRYLCAQRWEPGDEVLISAWNFWVVVGLVQQAGLRPVFVDTDPRTLCMDPEDAARKVGPRTRLLVLTHMFGHPGPAVQLRALCDDHDLLMVEDCAHALGTEVQTPQGSRPAGTLGHAALFSFGMFKSVNALGGGMLVIPPGAPVPPPLPAARGSMTEQHTRALLSLMLQPPVWTTVLGPALRALPPLAQALDAKEPPATWRFDPETRAPWHPFMAEAVGRQLAVMDDELERRRSIAARVRDALADGDEVRALDADRHGRANGSYLGVWVRTPVRAVRALAAAGIEGKLLQFRNCARLPLFSAHSTRCAGAEELDLHLLRLPSFPHLSDAAVDRMCRVLAAL